MNRNVHSSSTRASIDPREILFAAAAAVILGIAKRLL